jgi:hypothetical protein
MGDLMSWYVTGDPYPANAMTLRGAPMPKCVATTNAGDPCRNSAVTNEELCYQHIKWPPTTTVTEPVANGVRAAALVTMIRCPHCGQLSEPPSVIYPLEA